MQLGGWLVQVFHSRGASLKLPSIDVARPQETPKKLQGLRLKSAELQGRLRSLRGSFVNLLRIRHKGYRDFLGCLR